MKLPLKFGLIASIIAIAATSSVEIVFAKTENDFFQFCTTKAYGWPAPWKVEYCECEGGESKFPNSSKIINLAAIAGSDILGFAFAGGFSLLLSCRY